jgi:hypothetical protein
LAGLVGGLPASATSGAARNKEFWDRFVRNPRYGPVRALCLTLDDGVDVTCRFARRVLRDPAYTWAVEALAASEPGSPAARFADPALLPQPRTPAEREVDALYAQAAETIPRESAAVRHLRRQNALRRSLRRLWESQTGKARPPNNDEAP